MPVSSSTSSTFTGQDNQYPVFEPNQVLTSDLLNQANYYLDDEIRESRVKLIGMGILCGLEFQVANDTGTPLVHLTCGKAITSYGYLVDVAATTYDRYRVYNDPAGYDRFGEAADSGATGYNLFELVPQGAPLEDSTGGVLELNDAFLADKVMLLYVEVYDKDNKSCLGQDCDDKGITRKLTIRTLLIDENDAETMQRQSYGIGGGVLETQLNKRFDLPEVYMPRMTLVPRGTGPGSFNSMVDAIQSQDTLNGRYTDAFYNTSTTFVAELAAALRHSYTTFEPVLSSQYDEPPFDDAESYIMFALSAAGDSMQYVYDFCRDLTLAYNEWRQEAALLTEECCPDVEAFPMHVLVGRADMPPISSPRQQALRTYFTQSPIYNRGNQRLLRMRILHGRMVLMFEYFNTASLGSGTRITPSKEKLTRLSERSVPFYYFNSGSPGETSLLLTYWDFDKWVRDRYSENLHYYASEYGMPDLMQNPLFQLHEQYDFYRVEGILGEELNTVLAALDRERKLHGLDFHVKPLKLQHDPTDLLWEGDATLYSLKDTYVAERARFMCLCKNLLAIPVVADGAKATVTISGKVSTVGHDDIDTLLSEMHLDTEVLMALLPRCLDDFHGSPVGDFFNAYRQLVDKVYAVGLFYNNVIAVLSAASAASGSTSGVDIVGMGTANLVNLLIGVGKMWDFVRNCDIASLLTPVQLYTWRVEALQKANYFSNYAKQQPGMQHMGGVPKGGTLILPYTNEAGVNIVRGDLALHHAPQCCAIDQPFCENPDNYNFGPYAWPTASSADATGIATIDIISNAVDVDGDSIRIHHLQGGDETSGVTAMGASLNVSGYGENAVVEADYSSVTITFGADEYIVIDSFEYELTDVDDGVTPEGGQIAYSRAFIVHFNPDLATALATSADEDDDTGTTIPGGGKPDFHGWVYHTPDDLVLVSPYVEWGGYTAANPARAFKPRIDPEIESLHIKFEDLIDPDGPYGPIINENDDAKYWIDRGIAFTEEVAEIHNHAGKMISYQTGALDNRHATEMESIMTGLYSVMRNAHDQIAAVDAEASPTTEQLAARQAAERLIEGVGSGYGDMLGFTLNMAKASARNLDADNSYHSVLNQSVGVQLTQLAGIAEAAVAAGGDAAIASATEAVFGVLSVESELVENTYQLQTENAGYAATVSHLGGLNFSVSM